MSRVRRFLILCAIPTALTMCVAAQTTTRARRTQPVAPPVAQSATDVNEDFDLNITQRRITEHDFFASTSVALGDESSPLVRIGVALGAQEIDVLLQGVRGHVRFHASLAQLTRIINARRAASPQEGRPVP
jgi:hypothetical protein